MSFLTNLQYLRAERHMTQEQLAMLLGVSRQSVTKWEAEKSYPEMDKLIKMCQIFECSLDDLVQGDVFRHGVPTRDDLGGYSPVRVATEGAVGDMSAGPLTVAPRDASLGEPAGTCTRTFLRRCLCYSRRSSCGCMWLRRAHGHLRAQNRDWRRALYPRCGGRHLRR